MSSGYERELAVALEAVRLAARLCRSVQQRRVGSIEKADRSPVTVADFGSQAVVGRALAQAFPDDAVVAEEKSSVLVESGGEEALAAVQEELAAVGVQATRSEICEWIDWGRTDGAARRWLLDPIDGTKGFLRGGQYAVALALAEEGRLVVAVLACPNLPVQSLDSNSDVGSLFFAVAGQGSQFQPLEGGTATPVRVSQCRDPAEALVCESLESAHTAHDRSAAVQQRLGVTRRALRLDSQAKYALVARGEADVYLRLPSDPQYREKVWDHAAGALLVEQSGGTVTDVNGQPLDFTVGRRLEKNCGVVVTNGLLHDGVLQAIRQVGVE